MNYLELEREAYMVGNTTLAQAYARIIELEAEAEALEEKLETATENANTLESWENENGSANDYCQFFHECFARLAGHYPCPSIGSDYNKSIIFAAIDKGKGVTE